MRTFDTGATRDDDSTKDDPEGFLSPLVINRFNQYMSVHRIQADGKVRASDNWQKGIPKSAYMKSMWRHFLDVWSLHRGCNGPSSQDLETSLCSIMFNAMGYLHELLDTKQQTAGAGLVRDDSTCIPKIVVNTLSGIIAVVNSTDPATGEMHLLLLTGPSAGKPTFGQPDNWKPRENSSSILYDSEFPQDGPEARYAFAVSAENDDYWAANMINGSHAGLFVNLPKTRWLRYYA
jgi:hypothetical protein